MFLPLGIKQDNGYILVPVRFDALDERFVGLVPLGRELHIGRRSEPRPIHFAAIFNPLFAPLSSHNTDRHLDAKERRRRTWSGWVGGACCHAWTGNESAGGSAKGAQDPQEDYCHHHLRSCQVLLPVRSHCNTNTGPLFS